jgi:hypothetical protein
MSVQGQLAKRGIRLTAAALGITMLAACAKPAPPPVAAAIVIPPPPPAPVEVIPFRPLPPGGAAYVMNIPRMGSSGLRETVNTNLTDDEKVWHFRSGWNAAALNCTAPEYAPINTAYNQFINKHQRALVRVNNRLEEQFRKAEGSKRAALLAREEKLTKVYNFFSLPPARRQFCTTMLALSNDALANPITDPVAYALQNFELIQNPFFTFFAEYETYERESALWDRKYGATYGASQEGWVAVQKARAEGNPHVPTVGDSELAATLANPGTMGTAVADPESGVSVPIIPVDDGAVSQPVVQPIPTEGTPGKR